MSVKLFSCWLHMLFTSSYAQTGSGAHKPSHSIDKSGYFLGISSVQRLRMGIRQLSASRQAQWLYSDFRILEMI